MTELPFAFVIHTFPPPSIAAEVGLLNPPPLYVTPSVRSSAEEIVGLNTRNALAFERIAGTLREGLRAILNAAEIVSVGLLLSAFGAALNRFVQPVLLDPFVFTQAASELAIVLSSAVGKTTLVVELFAMPVVVSTKVAISAKALAMPGVLLAGAPTFVPVMNGANAHTVATVVTSLISMTEL